MGPLAFVIFQLVVLGVAYVAHVRRHPSLVYRFAWLASLCGVVGLDIWYFLDFAYPSGFKL